MMSYFDDGEPRAQRVIRLLDAWLRDDTPPHVWQGLVKLGELEDAVYRFIFLKEANLYELKKAHQGLDDIERMDDEETKDSQQWLDDFWEHNDCCLPPQEDFIGAARCWADGCIHPTFENDGCFIWCGEMSVSCDIPPELWTHVEIVLGAPIPADRKAGRFTQGG